MIPTYVAKTCSMIQGGLGIFLLLLSSGSPLRAQLAEDYSQAVELPAGYIQPDLVHPWEVTTTDALDAADALRSPVLSQATPQASIKLVFPEPGVFTFSWRTENFSWNMYFALDGPNGESRMFEQRPVDNERISKGWRTYTQRVSGQVDLRISGISWLSQEDAAGRVVLDQLRFVPDSGGTVPLIMVEGDILAPTSPFSWKVPTRGSGPFTYAAQGLPAGLHVDSATGEFSSAGRASMSPEDGPVKLTVSNAAGSHTAMLHFGFSSAIKSILDPGNGLLPTVLRSNAGRHFPEIDPSGVDGSGSYYQSDGSSDPPVIETIINGPATVRWHYIPQTSHAPVQVRVLEMDGVLLPAVTSTIGEVWQRVDTPVPAGQHTLRWLLRSVAVDAIAHLELDAPQLQGPHQFSVTPSVAFSLPIQTTRPDTSFTLLDALPNGVTLDSTTGMLSGFTNQVGAYPFTVGLTNEAGTTQVRLTLLVAPPLFGSSGLTWRQELTFNASPLLPAPQPNFPETARLNVNAPHELRITSLVTEVTGPVDVLVVAEATPWFEAWLDDAAPVAMEQSQMWRRIPIPAGSHTLRLRYAYAGWASTQYQIQQIKVLPIGVMDQFTYAIRAESGFSSPATVPLYFGPMITSWSLSGFPSHVSLDGTGQVTFTPALNTSIYGLLHLQGATFGSMSIPWRLQGTAPIVPIIGDQGLRWWMEEGPQGGWDLPSNTRTARSIGAPCGTLATKVTGPARLEFRWQVLRRTPLAALDVTLDGTTRRLSAPFLNQWNEESIEIPTGEHVVKFFYPDRSGDLRLGSVRRIDPLEPRLVIRQGGDIFRYKVGQWFQLDLLSEPPATSWSLQGSLPPGLHFNAETGSIFGIPLGNGDNTISVTASRGALTETQPLSFSTNPNSIIAKAAPGENTELINDPVRPWNISASALGIFAYSNTPSGEATELTMRIKGPDTLIFDSASTESGFFQVDANPVVPVSDRRYEIAIPAGTHVVRWSTNTHMFLRQILMKRSASLAWGAMDDIEVAAGVPFSIPLTLYGEHDAVWIETAPSGVTVDLATLTLTGKIDAPGTYRRWFKAAHGNVIDSTYLRLKVVAPLVTVPELSQALDSPGLTWATTLAPALGWRAEPLAGALGGGAATMYLDEPDAQVQLETTVPGGITYGLRWKNVTSLRGYKNGASTPELEFKAAGPFDWTELLIPLSPGTWRIVFENSGAGPTEPHHAVDYFSPLPISIAPEIMESTGAMLGFPVGEAMSHTFLSKPMGATWSAQNLPAGISLNPNTGVLSGIPNGSGIFLVNLTATNNVGTDSMLVEMHIQPNLSAALDTPGLVWEIDNWEDFWQDRPQQPYKIGWVGTHEGSWDGTDALTIQPLFSSVEGWSIVGEATTTLRTTITGPCVAQIRCRLGPGEGSLYLLLNGERQYPSLYLGDDLWHTMTVAIPEGNHEIGILYDYDEGDPVITPGQQVWIDDFRLSTDGRPMIAQHNIPHQFTHGQLISFDFHLVTPDATAVWSATALPPGLTLHPATGVLTGAPNQGGIYPTRIFVTTASGTASTDVSMRVSSSIPEALGLPGVVWTANPATIIGSPTAVWQAYSWGMDGPSVAYHNTSGVPSTLSTTLQGPDTLSFWWSGSGSLSVTVDGVTQQITPESTNAEWHLHEIVLGPGTHSVGLTAINRINIDEMRLDSRGIARFREPWQEVIPCVLFQPFEVFLPFANGPATVDIPYLPEGLSFDPATGRIFGVPTQTSFSSLVSVTNAMGTTKGQLKFAFNYDPREGLDLPLDYPIFAAPFSSQSSAASTRFADRPTGDIALLRRFSFNANPLLTIMLTGPTTVAFDHQAPDAGSSYRILLSNLTVASHDQPTTWKRTVLDVPEGTHPLTFEVLNPGGSLQLDDFRFQNLHPIPEIPTEWLLTPGMNSRTMINRGAPGLWSATGLPPGFSIHPNTGVISGIASEGEWTAEISLGNDSLPLFLAYGKLAAALETESTLPNWIGQGFVGRTTHGALVGEDCVQAALPPDHPADQPATLTTAVAGPGKLGWVWLGSATVLLDGVPVQSITAAPGWLIGAVEIPAGAHTIQFRTHSSAFIDGVFLTGFSAWSSARGMPATAGLNSDTDHDGIPLFAEYAWGLDPLRPGNWPALPISLQPDAAAGTLILDWPLPILDGVKWRAEASCDLMDWDASALLIENTGSRLRVRMNQPAGPRCFFRLRPEVRE